MTDKNKKEIINIYYLNNINGERDKYKLVVVEMTKVLINYGDKMDQFVLNQDEIWWQDNVIIHSNKINHYKSKVTGEKLVVISENKSLKRIEYIPPENVN